jgi:methylenetetrahydrofolate dehydrogenase (NADP+) / methenyltetrahydrofolate cyclohydrolase
MMILDGKILRDKIKIRLKERISGFMKEGEISPALAILQVGNNPASNVFIKMKKVFGESIGVNIIHKKFDETIPSTSLKKEIELINKDKTIHGVIVQLPLPSHLDKLEIIETIDPAKDADGLHSKNRIYSSFPKNIKDKRNLGIMPATTRGVMTLLSYYGIDISGKNILVIGRSYLVGTPTALAFLNKDATVTVAHRKTDNLKILCLNADIIISAAGVPGLVREDMVKTNQIIIDIGITSVEGGIKGDVEYETVSKVVTAITPVPGGVGPMTVASLFENLTDLYEKTLQ